MSSVDAERNGVSIRLEAPRWHPDHADDVVVSNPSPEAVEGAIQRLNNRDYNDIYLMTSDPDVFLGVCGGNGRYMVTVVWAREDRFGQLVNPQDGSDAQETIMCGGQRTPVPRRYLVDVTTALTAAWHYLDVREAAPELTWEWTS